MPGAQCLTQGLPTLTKQAEGKAAQRTAQAPGCVGPQAGNLFTTLRAHLLEQERGKVANGEGAPGPADDDAEHRRHQGLLGPPHVLRVGRIRVRVCTLHLVHRQVCQGCLHCGLRTSTASQSPVALRLSQKSRLPSRCGKPVQQKCMLLRRGRRDAGPFQQV